MKRQHFLTTGLFVVLCMVAYLPQAQAQEGNIEAKKIIADLEVKSALCYKANNKYDSPAHSACKKCFHRIRDVRRRLREEDIKKANDICNEAVAIMNPETQDAYRKRTELEKLKERIDKTYVFIKTDPQMSDARINKICDLYDKQIRYIETLPWREKSIGVDKELNLSAFSDEQRIELTIHRRNLRENVHKLLFAYETGKPVYRHLFYNSPNYCTLKYELEKKKTLYNK
ncbi:MAG: hypothetical protein KAJ86_06735 [Alphaproteobacteria bacterium]|nr:hypothetical protein [Alphaproteobacteria bacterium]